MRQRPIRALTLCVCSLAIAASACGSDDASTESTPAVAASTAATQSSAAPANTDAPTETSGGSSGTTASSDPGGDDLASIVEEFSGPVSAESYDPGPLTKSPAGKHVYFVNAVPSESGRLITSQTEDIVKSLGMETTVLEPGTTAESIADAFDQIVADSTTAAVWTLSLDPSRWLPQFEELTDRGVAVVLQSSPDNPVYDDRSINFHSSSRATGRIVKVAADWIINDSGGDAKVAMFNIPISPTLAQAEETFKAELEAQCPDCTFGSQSAPGFESIGKDLPGLVVSYLQAHPDTDYVFVPFGDMMIGVPAALQAAGITGVKFVSQSPRATNVQYMKDGQEAAEMAYPFDLLAYVGADTIARGVTGQDNSVADAWLMPFQIMTPDNLDGGTFDDGGGAIVEGIEDYFQNLWAEAK